MDRKTPKFTKRDFQWIADECKDHFSYLTYEVEAQKLDEYTKDYLEFAHWKFVQYLSQRLKATNGMYNRDKFLEAATPEEIRKKYYLGVVPQPKKEEVNAS